MKCLRKIHLHNNFTTKWYIITKIFTSFNIKINLICSKNTYKISLDQWVKWHLMQKEVNSSNLFN